MTEREHQADPVLLPTHNIGICLPMNTKYVSASPIARFLIRRFMRSLVDLAENAHPRSILDVGCGEGLIIRQLRVLWDRVDLHGLDVDGRLLKAAQDVAADATYVTGSIYELPVADSCYDLVVCTEVLEHVEDAERALAEVVRVARSHCLLSVPNEPWWRIANTMRGRYLTSLGNSPGHINHWSRNSFISFVACFLDIVDIRQPFPWTMVLGRVSSSPQCL
jgi:2-polyprenyl-3-methyl-5-hydroxy-6-metoxy-1,4-benzoquinol methylase